MFYPKISVTVEDNGTPVEVTANKLFTIKNDLLSDKTFINNRH